MTSEVIIVELSDVGVGIQYPVLQKPRLQWVRRLENEREREVNTSGRCARVAHAAILTEHIQRKREGGSSSTAMLGPGFKGLAVSQPANARALLKSKCTTWRGPSQRESPSMPFIEMEINIIANLPGKGFVCKAASLGMAHDRPISIV